MMSDVTLTLQRERLYRRAKRNDIKIFREGLPDLDVEVQHMEKAGTIENKICMTITDSINPPAETAQNVHILVLTGDGFPPERRQGWRVYNYIKGGRVHIMSLESLKYHCDTSFDRLDNL